MRFDSQGRRSSILLEVLELTEDGLQPVGVWNTTEGLNITRTRPWAQRAAAVNHNPIFFNKTLSVLIAMVIATESKRIFREFVRNIPTLLGREAFPIN